jgi:hypothetical protein
MAIAIHPPLRQTAGARPSFKFFSGGRAGLRKAYSAIVLLAESPFKSGNY